MNRKMLFILTIALLLAEWGHAQCLPDRHSTSWYDGWVSCSAAQSPNPARGMSHWVMYNFGQPYNLSTSTLWNSNDPAHLDYGIQGYTVDYSLNGTTWTPLGVFVAGQASGSPMYQGAEGPDFKNAIAQYVLLTATSNYGGSCFGFGEIKIDLTDAGHGKPDIPSTQWVVYPNPFRDRLSFKSFHHSITGPVLIEIVDITGRKVFSITVSGDTFSDGYSLLNEQMGLVPGIYSVSISNQNQSQTCKVIKL